MSHNLNNVCEFKKYQKVKIGRDFEKCSQNEKKITDKEFSWISILKMFDNLQVFFII